MNSKSQEEIEMEFLEKICYLYDISIDQLHFLVAIDYNFVYEFVKNDTEYILRGGTRHSPDQVKAELEWILFLDSCDVKVSLPIRSINDNYHEIIEHQGEEVSAVVFEKAPGREVRFRDSDEWNETTWEEMGRTLGRMHSAAVKFNDLTPKHKRKTEFESIHASSEEILNPERDAIVIERFNALKKKLKQLPREKHSFGLIQNDFHVGNFTLNDGEIIVFDFDDSYYFFYIYDLAACIHEAIWVYPDEIKVSFANRFIPSLWKGYCEEFTLDRKWLAYLSDFLKWREFIIYVTVIETLEDETTPSKYIPEYKEYAVEFKQRTESDDQIVPIPDDLSKWFREC